MNGNGSSIESRSDQSDQPKIDKHHCKCFRLSNLPSRQKLYEGLGGIGAYDQLAQENHGQRWSLTYTLDGFWQLHVKMMPDNHVECEIEPRIRFLEHQTMKSKPAHEEMQQLLENLGINDYAFVTPIPEPCKNRSLNTPANSTDITEIIMATCFAIISVVAAIVIFYLISRSMKNS